VSSLVHDAHAALAELAAKLVARKPVLLGLLELSVEQATGLPEQ
jgi:hypothetical protein